MTVDQQIIALLAQYGHLNHPFGDPATDIPSDPGDEDYPTLLSDPRVMRAVQSYQDFSALTLESLIAKHYPERRSAAVRADGIVGPATAELFSLPRCGMADYSAADPMEAIGAGPWKSCHNIGNFHSCSVQFVNDPPAWLSPLLPEICRRVQQAYDEVGLRFWFTLPGEEPEHTPVQIEASFVGSSSGWIGLSLLGNRGMGCGNEGYWCKFLQTYKGGSTKEDQIQQWTTLVKHEIGHSCRYNHTRGGVMNPSIVNGLPISWKNDPLWDTLVADFGGVPVPVSDPGPGPLPPNAASIAGTLKITVEGKDLGDYILVPRPRV